MEPPAASKLNLDSIQHFEPCHCEHGVARGRTELAMSVYTKMPCSNLQEVLHEVSYLRYAKCLRLRFSDSMQSSLQGGCSLFAPIQEIRPKVGGGRSFVGGCSFVRLRYILYDVVHRKIIYLPP